MCSETTAISVCPKRVPMVRRKAFGTIKISLGKPAYFCVPFICSWTERPEDPVRKASVNVQGVPRLKQETFEMCSEDPAPRAFPRTAAHANLESGKVQLCGPQSRSDHSKGRARQGGTPYEADDGSIRMSRMLSTQPSQSTNKHAYRLREHTSPAYN
ncbi:hypothetical protein CRG98_039949 [Punica granatum]|uniref:Uncharacterized protein n=1 Tax=Punica granatum TaxID=22663 RepID=A0A2I0I6N4_PUNGR|nr:hypothetical protein CRG98_039949 [Punica granatum]